MARAVGRSAASEGEQRQLALMEEPKGVPPEPHWVGHAVEGAVLG